MMCDPEEQLQGLGVFVHGVLAGLHILGAVFNWRRKNWVDVTAHTAAAGYDVWAANKHLNCVRGLKNRR